MRQLSVPATELRALMPDDADAARAFVARLHGGTHYEPRLLELLDSALRFEDPEFLALLAHDHTSSELRGIVFFGTVAGALQVVKVHALLGAELATLVALLDGVGRMADASGERMIVCEVPDEPSFALDTEALGESGYLEEGRVPDFVRDGVALRLMVRRASAG